MGRRSAGRILHHHDGHDDPDNGGADRRYGGYLGPVGHSDGFGSLWRVWPASSAHNMAADRWADYGCKRRFDVAQLGCCRAIPSGNFLARHPSDPFMAQNMINGAL